MFVGDNRKGNRVIGQDRLEWRGEAHKLDPFHSLPNVHVEKPLVCLQRLLRTSLSFATINCFSSGYFFYISELTVLSQKRSCLRKITKCENIMKIRRAGEGWEVTTMQLVAFWERNTQFREDEYIEQHNIWLVSKRFAKPLFKKNESFDTCHLEANRERHTQHCESKRTEE